MFVMPFRDRNGQGSTDWSLPTQIQAQQRCPVICSRIRERSSTYLTVLGGLIRQGSMPFSNTVHSQGSCLSSMPPLISWYSLWLIYHLSNYAPFTIKTYVTGLSYQHKLEGRQDPTNSFLLSKLLEGSICRDSRCDGQLPLTELKTQNSEIHFLTQNFTIRYNIAFNMINII